MSSTTQASNQPQPAPSEKVESEQLHPTHPQPSKPEQTQPESTSSASNHAKQLKPNPHQPKPPGYLRGQSSRPQPEQLEPSQVQSNEAQPGQLQANQTQASQTQANQSQPNQSRASKSQSTRSASHRSEQSPSGQAATQPKPVKATAQSVAQSQAATQPQPAIQAKSTVKVLYSPAVRPRSKWRIFWGAIALVSIWVMLMHLLVLQITQHMPTQIADAGLQSPRLLQLAKPDITPKRVPPPSSQPNTASVVASAPGYGHFLYSEASPEELMIVGSYSQAAEDGFEQMHEEAGLALLRMIDAARQDGVWLVPVSGFRDFARQEMLFQLQIKQVGSAKAAARSVAPAGYSEHHTGYAVDLADGLARAMDLSLAFGNTPAFKWLTRYAVDFGFELSFPENNPQGVIYEPWHWRFVDSPTATQTFAQARESAFCETRSISPEGAIACSQ